MEQGALIDGLMEFGLTRQEAAIYIALSKSNALTGYEVAKVTGISRSNAYSSLSGLVDKGAANVIEGESTKYSAVKITEFADDRIRNLQSEKVRLEKNLPSLKAEEEGYITIKGGKNIFNKAVTMLLAAEQRVYMSMTVAYVQEFEETLRQLEQKGIKIIIITDKAIEIPGATVYISEEKATQIGIITDSVNVLTGEYRHSSDDTALYTGQCNFVRVFKDSLKNEIELIELKKETK